MRNQLTDVGRGENCVGGGGEGDQRPSVYSLHWPSGTGSILSLFIAGEGVRGGDVTRVKGVDRVKRGWACNPHPAGPKILSLLNVCKKEAIAILQYVLSRPWG